MKEQLHRRAKEIYARQRATTVDALQFDGPSVIHPLFTFDSSHVPCAYQEMMDHGEASLPNCQKKSRLSICDVGESGTYAIQD